MRRTITVKGSKNEKIAPDWTNISMSLMVRSKDYATVSKESAQKLETLKQCLQKVGFDTKDIKTSSFIVETEYENVCDERGKYHREFKGYMSKHELSVGFAMSAQLLSQTIEAVVSCEVQPEFSISFSVRDTEKAKERLLRATTVDAKQKAKILCESAGVLLGQLISVDYQWGDMDFYSPTQYSLRNVMTCDSAATGTSMDFVPNDVQVQLSVTYVWEIL